MAFDYMTYCKVIDEFLIKMERVSDIKHSDTEKALSGICSFLRVARLEINLFDNMEAEKLANGQYTLIYSEENYDASHNLVQRNIADKDKLESIMAYLKGTNVDYDADKTMFISATAGFYDIPGTVTSPGQIMDCITTSVNAAKHILKQQFVFYKDELQEQINDYIELEKLFPTAIKNEEFRVYYQPKVNLYDYTLAGAEALCRWYHNGEIILPFRFIPMLEQTKAICTLDFYMLEHVCKDIRCWLDRGHTPVKVSVNFSRCHLGNVNLLNQILDIINKYNIPHKYIEIELTETTTDVDFIDLKSIVRGLQAEDISTSVGDFGIGYSSLNLIRELPWNVLKIDKSFLTASDDSNKNNIMLKHVISMAHDLGLECIVEGVETTEQIRLLKENHCFNAQGFYFDKPLPKEEFEQRLFGMHPYK